VQLLNRLGLDRSPEGALDQRLTASIEHQHGRTDQRGQGGRERVEPSLGEHDPLQAVVRGDRPTQNPVLLVDQLGERRLGQGDERDLVRNLEHRELALGGRLKQRRRDLIVAEADPEPEPGQLVAASRATNSRCRALE
jgi:hypothetical protein